MIGNNEISSSDEESSLSEDEDAEFDSHQAVGGSSNEELEMHRFDDTSPNRGLVSGTVDSRFFEPGLIRIIRLFQLRSAYPTQAKTLSVIRTSVIRTFSYSNRFSFPLGPIIG